MEGPYLVCKMRHEYQEGTTGDTSDLEIHCRHNGSQGKSTVEEGRGASFPVSVLSHGFEFETQLLEK